MTDLAVVEAEVVDTRTLTEIETSIRGHMATLVKGTVEAAEARIAIGHDLLEARQEFGENDKGFGQWAKERFPWDKSWRLLLMQAAENEVAVRGLLESQLASKKELNFEKLVRTALPEKSTSQARPLQIAPATGTYSTIVIDPPWQYDNRGTRNAAEKQYDTMNQDQLEEVQVPAATDSHLYLWVTNGMLRQGLDLMDAWRFSYKTMLTWCKPQIGMGNYFRNSTEHVLFGVRGSLEVQDKSIGTWFKANRKKHSQKPESFYDLVEKVSPGPYLEMFARRRRLNWDVWGDEA